MAGWTSVLFFLPDEPQLRHNVLRWTEAGRLSSGKRAAAPNEVWTVDFKGWWRSWGKRCEPLTVRDEHSRYVLELRVMESAGTDKVRQSFERLFERAGLPEAIPQRQRRALCQRAPLKQNAKRWRRSAQIKPQMGQKSVNMN